MVSTFAGGGRAAVLLLIEAVAMVVLIFLVARRAPARQAVGAGLLVAVAAAVMIIVEAPAEDSAREAVGGVAFWLQVLIFWVWGVSLTAATAIYAARAWRARLRPREA